MPRMSKKLKHEWSLFLNHRGRRCYNSLCRRCVHSCDGNTLALMNSGIMTADEYSRLIDSAIASGNYTMTRLLAKSAADMAEKVNDSDVARSYRLVSHKGKGMDGREYLQAFDFMVDTYNRCERNFALTTKWDELTSPVVESF